jgi:hypothetical protein
MSEPAEKTPPQKNLWDKKDPWLPHAVSWYESRVWTVIHKTPTVTNAYKIKKNICYNLQYLEYLDQTLAQLNLTGVLITLTWKTYIITATSIIEAIYYYMVKKHEKNLKPDWVEIEKDITNSKSKEGELPTRKVVITERQKHVEIKTDIKFNQLSRKVEDNKLLGDTTIYPKVKLLRDLRNRIHLFASDDKAQMDTDYNAFNKSDYLLAKELLAEVLLNTGMLGYYHLVEIGLMEEKTLLEPEETEPF